MYIIFLCLYIINMFKSLLHVPARCVWLNWYTELYLHTIYFPFGMYRSNSIYYSKRWRECSDRQNSICTDPHSDSNFLLVLSSSAAKWPLSRECSLACHTYRDTGNSFIMVISEDPWYSHLLPILKQWSCHYLFLWRRSVAAGIRTANLPLAGPTL